MEEKEILEKELGILDIKNEILQEIKQNFESEKVELKKWLYKTIIDNKNVEMQKPQEQKDLLKTFEEML